MKILTYKIKQDIAAVLVRLADVANDPTLETLLLSYIIRSIQNDFKNYLTYSSQYTGQIRQGVVTNANIIIEGVLISRSPPALSQRISEYSQFARVRSEDSKISFDEIGRELLANYSDEEQSLFFEVIIDGLLQIFK